MDNSKSQSETKKAILEASYALFELRDAFMEMSLAIKDWQFEIDLERRKKIETDVRCLLQKLAAGQ